MDDPKQQIDQIEEDAKRQKEEVAEQEAQRIQEEADRQKEEIRNDAEEE